LQTGLDAQNRLELEPGLLFEFAEDGVLDRFLAFDYSAGELEDPGVDWMAEVPDDDEIALVAFANDRDDLDSAFGIEEGLLDALVFVGLAFFGFDVEDLEGVEGSFVNDLLFDWGLVRHFGLLIVVAVYVCRPNFAFI
jgi:hypothetical protein